MILTEKIFFIIFFFSLSSSLFYSILFFSSPFSILLSWFLPFQYFILKRSSIFNLSEKISYKYFLCVIKENFLKIFTRPKLQNKFSLFLPDSKQPTKLRWEVAEWIAQIEVKTTQDLTQLETSKYSEPWRIVDFSKLQFL